jgi:hypothetical protein
MKTKLIGKGSEFLTLSGCYSEKTINSEIHNNKCRVMIMVLNATFNNISVIQWWSVLLVEETGVTRENHRPATSHWQKSTPHLSGIRTHNVSGDRHFVLVVINP